MRRRQSRGFLDYSKRLLSRWNGIYGLLTFGVAIVSVLGMDLVVPNLVWRVLLVLSLYLGGYFVYRDVAPDLAKLVLRVSDIDFHEGGWSHQFPSDPSVRLRVGCTNQGSEKAKINRLSVADLNLSSPLFVAKEETIYETPARMGYPVHWPILLSGRDFKEFEVRIAVKLNARNAEQFAKELRSLVDFTLTVEVQYEDMEGGEHTRRIEVQALYDQFKQRAKENWKGRGEHALVYILEGLEA